MNKKVLWITRTAAFVALLIVMQAVTASFGNTLVTGSIVNMILIVSVMTCGPSTGITVAVVSPIFAKLVGIGPLWSLIPFIMLGNVVLVFAWFFIGNRNFGNKYISYIAALIAAAVCKYLVLYLGIVKIAIPFFLKLPDPQAGIISNTFSIPQLVTALIGGVCAILVLPVLHKAIRAQD